MEGFGLLRCFQLDSVARCQDLVGDGAPAVALDALVPPVVTVILWLVKLDVDGVLLHFLLDGVVVTRRKGIDVHDAAVSENFVVN